ncbi:DUF6965 family protein [Mongoliibacter ruber]|uniref:Toprim domain-containing protein n=1 Tax=Mongoliibacter ruber TaxID=1750599 RepID=A0A2T0WVY9_9BACT|nr:DUF6371 domain-containing protein [Mongoliibacter ruber]PRY90855.1 hypothetical protein CLW00_101530 [Mongoliibacter ruber]
MTNVDEQHRYKLEKGSKKHVCPACNRKTFVLYIDTETGDYLPEQYGRCDRESKCSYNLNPYLDGYAKAIWEQEQKVTGVTKVTVIKQKYFRTQPKPQPTPEPVLFDFNTFKQTLKPERYEKNTFIQNLFYRVQFPFEVDEVTKVVQLYRLGTVANGYRAGANTFPFIDIRGNVRAVQVKQFDEQNHTTGTDFLHSIIEKHHTRNNKPLPEWLEAYTKQDKRISCLFGEHLLSKYHSNPVALVEAPKTAVYGTLYFGLPQTPKDLIWLAVYNKSSFSFDKVKVLKGRFVYVFPDLSKDGNTFKEWETKAKEYERRLPGTRFIFSDLLEQLAPERDKNEGNDIADYLIKQDWRLFRKQDIQEQPPQPEPEKVTKVIKVTPQKNFIYSHATPLPKVEGFKTERIEHPIKGKPQNWSNEIAELEKYFAAIEPPTQPVKLNGCGTISDFPLFIETHFATVKANNGNRTYLPYLNRLQEMKQVFTIN